jgi:cardiolipin synthase
MKLHTEETPEIWNILIKACEDALVSICLEQYLVEDDEISKRLCDTLSRKAREGIEVKCLFDAVGSFNLGRSKLLSELSASGVQVEFFNWLWPFAPQNEKVLYFRNHRRVLLIDNKKAFTGSICFGDYTKEWKEAQVEITEPLLIEKMKEVFTIDWYRAKKRQLRIRKKAPEGQDGHAFVTSDPLPRRRFLYYRMISAIRKAEKSIYFITPYFLPDNRLLRALKVATSRGVDVRVVLPLSSGHSIVDYGARTYFEQALFSKIKIYRHQFVLHAKTAIIDDAWTTVGSLNLDNISLRYNFEANIVSSNPAFIADVKKHFWENLEQSAELTLPEWRKRAFIQQFFEMLVWPFRKLL